MFQAKGQDKPQKNSKEREITNLPNKVLKVMIIKMLSELGRGMQGQSESFKKV